MTRYRTILVHLAYRAAAAEWINLRLRRQRDQSRADNQRLWQAYRRLEAAEAGAREALEAERRHGPRRPYLVGDDDGPEAA